MLIDVSTFASVNKKSFIAFIIWKKTTFQGLLKKKES